MSVGKYKFQFWRKEVPRMEMRQGVKYREDSDFGIAHISFTSSMTNIPYLDTSHITKDDMCTRTGRRTRVHSESNSDSYMQELARKFSNAGCTTWDLSWDSMRCKYVLAARKASLLHWMWQRSRLSKEINSNSSEGVCFSAAEPQMRLDREIVVERRGSIIPRDSKHQVNDIMYH